MSSDRPTQLWCLHGAVGQAADWRGLSSAMAEAGIVTRAVDLWRYLDCCPMPMPDFGQALNAEARGSRGEARRVLLGYSMGGRLALQSLLEKDSPWDAAVIVSAHPGLESETERTARRETDAAWAGRALQLDWSEFLEIWNAQAILVGEVDGLGDRRLLSQRKREIARSFMDWSLGVQEPLWERLAEIKIPVLWVVGGRDEKFRQLGERAVSLLPDAELIVEESAGHRVPWEAAEGFSEMVHRFLNRESTRMDANGREDSGGSV